MLVFGYEWYAMSVMDGLENVVTCMMSECRLIEVVPNYIVNFTSLQTCMSVMCVCQCGVCLSVVCVSVWGVSERHVCECDGCASVWGMRERDACMSAWGVRQRWDMFRVLWQ